MRIIYYFLFILIVSGCQNASSPRENGASVAYIYDHETFARRSNDSKMDDDFTSRHSSYYTHRYYQPIYPVKMERYENDTPDFQNFIAQHGYHSSYRPLTGIVTENQEDILNATELLTRIQANIKNKKQLNLTTNEVLTKVVAYRNLKVGQKIPIPISNKLDTSKLVIYHVDKVFNLTAGMPAFGLVPHTKKAPPILLFRGTDFSLSLKGSASIFADLDLTGPGLTVFHSAQEDIHQWLESVSSTHSKARIMGYSLGGAFVQYTCIYEHELVCHDPRFPSVAFNQPGISEDLVEQWYQIKQEDRPPLKGYITEGDLVPTVGKLIGDVRELTLDHLLEPLFAHVTLMSLQQRLYTYRIDVTLKHELDYSVHKQELKQGCDFAPER